MLQAIANGLGLGGIYAMIAIGFSIIFNVTKTFHFAHGGVYLWTAYVIAFFLGKGSPLWFALALGLVVAVTLGTGMEMFIYRPMRRRGASGLSLFVASLGLLIFLQNLIQIVFGVDLQQVTLPYLQASVHFGSVVMLTAAVLQFVVAVIIVLGVSSLLRWTSLGYRMRAVASNIDMAALVGISPTRVYVLAFAVGSGLIVPAAYLNSVTSGLDPSVGETLMLI